MPPKQQQTVGRHSCDPDLGGRFPQSLENLHFQGAVYDLNSRLMETGSFDIPTGGADIFWAIDTGNWKPGVYLLNLESSGANYQINLLKE